MIGRREMLAATAAGIGAIASASGADACTLIATRRAKPFRSSTCERQIRQIVDFANLAHAKTDEEVAAWAEKTGIDAQYDGDDFDNNRVLQTMRISDGKVDLKPIRILEINLLRQLGNRASYQFTLRRNQFSAADDEGCNGLFTHGEFYSDVDTAFLAWFEDNEFQGFREFPEWYV